MAAIINGTISRKNASATTAIAAIIRRVRVEPSYGSMSTIATCDSKSAIAARSTSSHRRVALTSLRMNVLETLQAAGWGLGEKVMRPAMACLARLTYPDNKRKRWLVRKD